MSHSVIELKSLGHSSVLVGYYGRISCATGVSNSFFKLTLILQTLSPWAKHVAWGKGFSLDPSPKIFVMCGPIDLRFDINVNWTSNFHLIQIKWQLSSYHGDQGLYNYDGRHLGLIIVFWDLYKIQGHYKKWMGNTVLSDKNAQYWKQNEK